MLGKNIGYSVLQDCCKNQVGFVTRPLKPHRISQVLTHVLMAWTTNKLAHITWAKTGHKHAQLLRNTKQTEVVCPFDRYSTQSRVRGLGGEREGNKKRKWAIDTPNAQLRRKIWFPSVTNFAQLLARKYYHRPPDHILRCFLKQPDSKQLNQANGTHQIVREVPK